ncbi:MAG: hypothetical protein AAB895_01375 [Patescibacteria group bacterium]
MTTNLITETGPRGAGKDTVLSSIIEKFGSEIYRIKPCTTRAPRPGETHGIEQYFISEDEFKKYEELGKFAFVNPPHSGYRSGTLNTELIHPISIVDITALGAGILRDYVYLTRWESFIFFLVCRLQYSFPSYSEQAT